MRKFKCTICGYVYDEAAGIPEKSITPGTKWEDILEDFVCPVWLNMEQRKAKKILRRKQSS